MKNDPNYTHTSQTHVADIIITATSIEDAKAQFNCLLDGVQLDFEVNSMRLKIFGFIRTAVHPIKSIVN